MTDQSARARSSFALALVSIACLGPLAIDFFVALLPTVRAEFELPTAATQLVLTTFLVALGAGQLVVGPVSDAFGRRRPLLVGLALFVVGCVLASVAPTFEVLVAARLLQGLGGAAGAVMANTIIRDRVRGAGASRLIAIRMSLTCVGSLIAPGIGAVVGQWLGWRAAFIPMLLLGLVAIWATIRYLPESLPRDARVEFRPAAIARGYGQILNGTGSRRFLLASTVLFALTFAYVGGAPYVYQDQFGMPPQLFGVVYGASTAAIATGAALNVLVVRRLQPEGAIRLGAALYVSGSSAALALGLMHIGFWPSILSLFVMLVGITVAEPSLIIRYLEQVRGHTGTASAAIGALSYGLGAVGAAVVGVVVAQGAEVWFAVLVVCATGAAALSLPSGRSRTA